MVSVLGKVYAIKRGTNQEISRLPDKAPFPALHDWCRLAHERAGLINIDFKQASTSNIFVDEPVATSNRQYSVVPAASCLPNDASVTYSNQSSVLQFNLSHSL